MRASQRVRQRIVATRSILYGVRVWKRTTETFIDRCVTTEFRPSVLTVSCYYCGSTLTDYRTGRASVVMAAVFKRLPNLREIVFECCLRGKPEPGFSPAHAFSVVVGCLLGTEIKIQKLRLPFERTAFGATHEEGLSIQALSIPDTVSGHFSELRQLTLRLRTSDHNYRSVSLSAVRAPP